MKKTIFSGITVLGVDESIASDNGAFIGRDREEIDRALKIGVKTHRHDGSAGLPDPVAAPGAQVLGSGGTIAGNIGLTIGYTLLDLDGGETLISETALVTTPAPLEIPFTAPTAVFASAGGSLMVDTYTYALTYSDGEGGETSVGPSVTVDRPPGFASGQIALSGLTDGLEAAEAVGWRLYRARGGGLYVLLTEGGPGDDVFVDDGSISPDCDAHPPTDNINTTKQTNRIEVTLPGSAVVGDATFINLYASLTGEFGENSLLEQYPAASAGQEVIFDSLNFAERQPPDTNRSYGGAPKIDPDEELLDWHWKRPVLASANLPTEGNEEGDVRPILEAAEPTFYMFLNGQWVQVELGAGIAEVTDGSTTVDPAEAIEFAASGIASVAVDEPEAKRARVTLYTPSEVSTEIESPFYFRDDFNVDSIAAGDWDQLLENASISGGFLNLPGNGTAWLTRLAEPSNFADAIVEGHFRRVGAWSGNIYIGLKHQYEPEFQPKNYVALRVLGTGALRIIKVDNGSTTTLKEGVSMTFSANTDYWFRFKAEGDVLTGEWYNEDPAKGASPVATITHTLTGGDIAKFGTGVVGKHLYRVEGVDATKSAVTDYLQVSPLNPPVILPVQVDDVRHLKVLGSGAVEVDLEEDEPGVAVVTLNVESPDVLGSGITVSNPDDIEFFGSGRASATVTSPSAGVARVTLTVPPAGDEHWRSPVAGSADLSVGVEHDVRLAISGGKFGRGLYSVVSASAGVPGDWRRVTGVRFSVRNSAGTDIAEAANMTSIVFKKGAGVEIGGALVDVDSPHMGAQVTFSVPALANEGMGVIVHGATGATARGTIFKQYTWIGTVEPANAQDFDIWMDHNAGTTKVRVEGEWKAV